MLCFGLVWFDLAADFTRGSLLSPPAVDRNGIVSRNSRRCCFQFERTSLVFPYCGFFFSAAVVINKVNCELGLAAVKTIHKARGMKISGAVDSQKIGEDIGEIAGLDDALEIPVSNDLSIVLSSISQRRATGVVLDLSGPTGKFDTIKQCLAFGLVSRIIRSLAKNCVGVNGKEYVARAGEMSLVATLLESRCALLIHECRWRLESPSLKSVAKPLTNAAMSGVLSSLSHSLSFPSFFPHVKAAVVPGWDISPKVVKDLAEFCDKASIGCIIAPDLHIGSALLRQAAAKAAAYYKEARVSQIGGEPCRASPSAEAISFADAMSGFGQEFAHGTGDFLNPFVHAAAR